MGWNYVFQWAIVLPLEITVAGTTVMYWPNKVPIAGWITIFWAVIGELSPTYSIQLTYPFISSHCQCVWYPGFRGRRILVIMSQIICCHHVYFHRRVSNVVSHANACSALTHHRICICGGGPTDGAYGSYIGGLHWSKPGAFANGFKGVCAVFVTGTSQSITAASAHSKISIPAAFSFC